MENVPGGVWGVGKQEKGLGTEGVVAGLQREGAFPGILYYFEL